MNNNIPSSKLTRSQKILISLFQLANGTNKQVRFEDIAVTSYKNFTADFQLKGYPQYPDTGDIIHKPLYSELKKGGYVLSGNKYFSLTPKGIVYAKKLLRVSEKEVGQGKAPSFVKLTADQQKELERLKSSKAVELFLNGKKEEILDIDFYSYLEVTVRTNKYDFLGRLTTVEEAINATKDKSDELYKKLRECHAYLLNKFRDNLDFVRNSKGGKR
jgi:hypothetical protein